MTIMSLYNETVTLRRSRKYETNNNTIRSRSISQTEQSNSNLDMDECTVREQTLKQPKDASAKTKADAEVDGSFSWIFEKFKRASLKSSKTSKPSKSSPSLSIPSISSMESSSLNSINKAQLVDSDVNNSFCHPTTNSSLYIILSGKNDDSDVILEVLNECLHKLEDSICNESNYMIGSLIIHIKGLQKLYLQHLKKRKKKNRYEDMELENWKLIAVSVKLFVFEYCNDFKNVDNVEVVEDGGDAREEENNVIEAPKESSKYKLFKTLYRYESDEDHDDQNGNAEEFLNNLNLKLQNLQLNVL